MEVKSFFDIVNIIFQKKSIPSEEDINKHCNQYMINQLLSCDSQLVSLAFEMSKLKISNKEYFNCLYYGLPNTKKFIKYNASKVKEDEDIIYIMQHFNCTKEVAKDYIKLIDKNELKEIINFYTKRGIIK